MKIFTGKVISKKMDKTATVVVERTMAHPVYKKRITIAKKYHVHDEKGSKVDDTVEFVASKPYSKLKKWKVTKIVENESQPKQKAASKKKGSKKK